MKKYIALTVNDVVFEGYIPSNMTLLQFIRDELGLTGTKEGCGEGCCGACTVLLDGKAVNSCCVLVMQANGRNVQTIESLSSFGQLHPIQQAFVEVGAVQCGFCTPGMIMASLALLNENSDPTEDDIRKAISGNLCRCTGYVRIAEAVKMAARAIAVHKASIATEAHE